MLCENIDYVLYGGTYRGTETSEEIVAVLCAKDDGDSDLRSSSGKGLDLGCILKVEPAGFARISCAG